MELGNCNMAETLRLVQLRSTHFPRPRSPARNSSEPKAAFLVSLSQNNESDQRETKSVASRIRLFLFFMIVALMSSYMYRTRR